MKSFLHLAVCALSVLAFVSPSMGAEARGDFDFDLAGAAGTIVFDAGINNAGVVNGQMSFAATVDVEDPGGSGDPVPLDVEAAVDFDCMVVTGNRAAMSGVITSTNVPGLAGRQAVLVVEDKVEGVSPPTDAFVWGVYQPIFVNLAATDNDYCPVDPESEGPPPPCTNVDNGASLTWTATDYELCPAPPNTDTENFPAPPCPDPNGFTAGIPVSPTKVDCKSVRLAAYPLALIPNGGGNTVVVNPDQ